MVASWKLLLLHVSLVSCYTYSNWIQQLWKQWGGGRNTNYTVAFKCKTEYQKGEEGIIESPNHPFHYPNNADCKWIIETAKQFTQIQFELLKFNTENPRWSKVCFKDYMDIFQHIEGRPERRGRFCGKLTRRNITVYGNRADIIFKSNFFRTKKGFFIKWRAIKGCGGDLSGSHGDFTLPKSYHAEPQFYCEWRIAAPSAHNRIEIEIKKLSLQQNYTSCKRARLSVLNVHKETIATYCEDHVPSLLTISGNMAYIRIRFSTKTNHHIMIGSWRSEKQRTDAQQCGISPEYTEHQRHRRLVGGATVIRGVLPWVVQVRVMILGRNYRAKYVICGGVIISPLLILTAAHCVVRKSKILRYEILAGTTSEYTTDQTIIYITQNDVVQHPDFVWTPGGLPQNDIALLRLPQVLQFTPYIQPICLPNKVSVTGECQVSGWGKPGPNDPHSTQLKSLKAFNWGHCDRSPSIICVSYHGKSSGACKGDSGSPLMCKTDDGRSHLIGLLSYGAKTCPSTVDAYVDIKYHLDWINNGIKQNTITQNNNE